MQRVKLGILKIGLLGLTVGLAGCGTQPFAAKSPETDVTEAMTDSEAPAQEAALRPRARPAGLGRKPPTGARTAEALDTTTAAERVEAAAAPAEPAGERLLGETIASLGDVTRQGFWLETPLVSSPGQGRVLFPGSGKSAQVELIPIDGPATAGSRISLAAMRLIEAPLTDLPTLEVFTGG